MTNEEKYENLREELLGLIETGTLTIGMLGLSQNSFEFLIKFDLKNYDKKNTLNRRRTGNKRKTIRLHR